MTMFKRWRCPKCGTDGVHDADQCKLFALPMLIGEVLRQGEVMTINQRRGLQAHGQTRTYYGRSILGAPQWPEPDKE